MEVIQINVVDDILKFNTALHDFGKPVQLVIDEKLSVLTDRTLFVLNLREADPLDYEFVYVAFAKIFSEHYSNEKVYVVVKAGAWEAEEVLMGITKIMKIKLEKGKTDRQAVIDQKLYLVVIDKDNKPVYTTALSDADLEVLHYIQSNVKTTSAQIQHKFNLKVEDTSRILDDLKREKFIYSTNDKDGPYYHAIVNLI